jgi:diguanylate cyclase (GGDEF)-like protein
VAVDHAVGRVAELGKVVRIRDMASDPRLAEEAEVGGSLLAVPLSSSGQIMGVLAVTSARIDAFNAEHELLAMLLANCAVPAIDRARLERLAATDPDTRAFNRRYLFPRLRQEIRRARRYALPLSLLVMVLETESEDTRATLDTSRKALAGLADLVRGSVRVTDVLVRRERNEMLLIMPHTDEEQAFTVAQRVRAGVAREAGRQEGSSALAGHLISLSVATWNGQEGAKELELRADSAVTEAIRRGGNRVVLARALEEAARAARPG